MLGINKSSLVNLYWIAASDNPETSIHITQDVLQKTNIGKQTISATAVDLWQELTPDFNLFS